MDKLKRCRCGRSPAVRTSRVAEDAVSTWVECGCGRRGGEVEDAYADEGTAVDIWNSGSAVLSRLEREG